MANFRYPLVVVLLAFFGHDAIMAAESRPNTPEPAISTLAGAATPGSNQQQILGTLELRPSYRSRAGEVHSENFALLGYQFNSTSTLVYKQEFSTNVYDPHLALSKSGLNAYTYDGYLRGRINDFWKESAWSLSYEGRVYAPTFSVRRDAGMITSVRNYMKLRNRVTRNLVFALEEIPVLHFYDRAGFGKSANPVFENRVYLSADYVLTGALKIYFPFILSSTRYRDFSAKAKDNNAWGQLLWIHPELTYTLNRNFTLGVAYYSGYWSNSKMTEFDIAGALKNGTGQVILQTNL